MKFSKIKLSLVIATVVSGSLLFNTALIHASASPGLTPDVTGQYQTSPNTGQSANTSPSASPSGSVVTLKNPLDPKFDSVGKLIQGAVDIFAYLVIIFAVLAIIWTGFEFIIAQGSVTKMKDLKDRLLYIVIGVAIVIGARLIVSIVINTLEASGVVNSTVIQSAKNANSGQ